MLTQSLAEVSDPEHRAERRERRMDKLYDIAVDGEQKLPVLPPHQRRKSC